MVAMSALVYGAGAATIRNVKKGNYLESNDMWVLMWVRCGVTKKDNTRNEHYEKIGASDSRTSRK